MGRLDLGWNRDDIDFDTNGRLVIKNPALVREVQAVLRDAGRIEILTQSTATPGTVSQATGTLDPGKPDPDSEIYVRPLPKGPPQPNMCNCSNDGGDQRRPVELEEVKPEMEA